MEYIEKEIKVKIDDYKKLFDYLLKNGGVVLNKAKERTVRFDTPNNDLANQGKFLRVRSGSKTVITLKENAKQLTGIKTRKETELEIGNIDKMIHILKTLGFTHLRTMEKYRINVAYRGAVLSIDEMPFGMFLEVEGTKKQISEIAEELKVKPDERILSTYWGLFEEYKKENNISGDDILFPANHTPKIEL